MQRLLLETTWETDASSVGGLVTEALGHIPAEGETVVIGDYEFQVERVRDRIPQSVVARRVVPVASENRR
jgi:Mg2+/Co2+ transporter CorC